jgi:replicative DNA helicase
VDSTITIIDRVVLDKSKNSKVVTIAEACVQFIDQLSEHQKFDNKTVGQISTTIESLKKIVPYYLGGNLIVIAGRPAMGKTSFVLNEIWNAVKNGQKFLFFSLEMSARELAGRLIQHESGVTQFDMDRKLMPFEYEKLDKAMAKIEKTGLFIDDTGGVSFAHIRAKVKVYVKLHSINGIVIDYLQLMGTDRSLPREQQVAQLSGQLKALAKEFDIPVFLLAQLNRNAESRSNDGFKPKLSDLRESGAIEQDADIVMFPHRPEYYYQNDADLTGKAMVIVSKHRNGKVGEAELKVDLSRHKWTDIYENSETYTNEAVNLNFGPKQNNDFSSYETPF